MQIFAPDDPLVLNGTYDTEGYKPGERARIAKARARIEADMTKKRKPNGATRGRPRTPAPKPRARRGPRQAELPGTEDRSIAALEDAAQQYADLRDQRMALTKEETGLKAALLRLMKQHGKTTYHRDGISIEVVAEEETVKVRVKKETDDDEAGDEFEAPDEAQA